MIVLQGLSLLTMAGMSTFNVGSLPVAALASLVCLIVGSYCELLSRAGRSFSDRMGAVQAEKNIRLLSS